MDRGTPILLFASIDIAGSTAFKRATVHWKSLLYDFFTKIQPVAEKIWRKHKYLVQQDERFFNDYKQKFGDFSAEQNNLPRVWKTNGDEIVFTVPVLSNLDVIIACHCFSELIFYYSEELRKRSLEHTDQTRALSVKGTLWVSSFHTNAFAIPLSQIIGGSEQGSASLREYIGISIDAGFRIGRYADTNRISISVELADKLVQIMEKMSLRYLPRLHLKYDQGEPLKGLLRADEHYPRIWLDLDHDQDPPPGHKSLISRDPAKRADLRIAIDVLKNKFQNEFFNWPEHLANFYLLDAVENAEYGDL